MCGNDKANDKTNQMAQLMTKFLGCPCRYFAPMPDDEPIMEAYQEARQRGKKEGFTPILLTLEENLCEMALINSLPNLEYTNEDLFSKQNIDTAAIAEYRRQLLAKELPEGREVLQQMENDMRECAEEDGWDFDAETAGDLTNGYVNDRFAGYWNYSSKDTQPMLLAEIPTANPWEVFAWLPFGGWNDCPTEDQLMAACKRWFQLYGAEPAVISADTLECVLPQPAADSAEEARPLALELYCFCPDAVDQAADGFTVGSLAETLSLSKIWYFWWD